MIKFTAGNSFDFECYFLLGLEIYFLDISHHISVSLVSIQVQPTACLKHLIMATVLHLTKRCVVISAVKGPKAESRC